MVKKDYEEAKKFLYTDGTEIEDGDYFAKYIAITRDEDYKKDFLGFVSLKNNRKRYEKITIKQKWDKLFTTNYIPLIFKYIGENKAIELITNKKITLTKDNYIIDSFDSSYDFYNRLLDEMIIVNIKNNQVHKVSDDIKRIYSDLILNRNLEECVEKAFEHYETNVKAYYSKEISTTIYGKALVDNMMYDLDEKVKQKTLQ